MKFLEAKRASQQPKENKMAAGSRSDQDGGKRSIPAPKEQEKESEIPVIRPDVQALADELKVDLSTVTGTGANGSIRMRDVREAAVQQQKTEI